MGWLISFFENVFGRFWDRLYEWALKLIMGPVVFFLFGPVYKIAHKLAMKILDHVAPLMADVGFTADGFAAWMVDCLRIQQIIVAFLTFLMMGFTFSLLKKVF